MKKYLSISTLASLGLLLTGNTVWAATESAAASPPGLETLVLFGAVLLGLISVNQRTFKN